MHRIHIPESIQFDPDIRYRKIWFFRFIVYLCRVEKYFRTQEGEKVSIVDHTLEQINKWPNLKIYIGTDAQDQGQLTRFATCIVYRYGHRGAHFVSFLEEVPVVRDIYTRLYQEGVRTIDTALLISEHLPAITFEALEFDYADIKKTKSTPVIQALKGWVKGLNMNASFKSGGQLATKAADHVCRHPDQYR